jgi:hypothetical protein
VNDQNLHYIRRGLYLEPEITYGDDGGGDGGGGDGIDETVLVVVLGEALEMEKCFVTRSSGICFEYV